MAITGIDTIEGKQIIAAGAVSAKSAEMAYNDENGNPITGYQVAGDYLTTADSANFYTTANESGFITGVDLTPYQLTADMTAYQPIGDYLTTADSANFYTTANESGFISEVPAGTMNESAFSYDASDNITAYNGSAFKAGDEFPQSATEAIETVTANSADWNGTTDTVSSNSGAWGGSALPISAGPGVKISLQNDTLVFSNDETVLWSGYSTGSAPVFDLSDDISSFSYIEFYAVDDDGWCGYSRVESDYCTTANRIPTTIGHYGLGNKNFIIRGIYVHPTSNTHMDSKSFGFDYVNNCIENEKTHMTKIVGINRIAGGE